MFQTATKCSQSMDWISNFAVSQPPSPSPSTTTTIKLLDTFRYLNPDREGAYTCWSTFLDTRKTNYGTRIDYILASCSLAGKVTGADIWQDIKGSDHCPVFAEFDLNLRCSEKPMPSLCSAWFSGKQSKLSAFMAPSKKTEGAQSPEAKNSRGTKRTTAHPSAPPPPPKKKALGQTSLFSFSTAKPSPSNSKDSPSKGPLSVPSLPQGGKTGLSGAWKGMFGTVPKPPPCSGHKEPCVLRKVKKQGANKDKQFWVCARPMGSKGDPEASCNFFKWVKE